MLHKFMDCWDERGIDWRKEDYLPFMDCWCERLRSGKYKLVLEQVDKFVIKRVASYSSTTQREVWSILPLESEIVEPLWNFPTLIDAQAFTALYYGLRVSFSSSDQSELALRYLALTETLKRWFSEYAFDVEEEAMDFFDGKKPPKRGVKPKYDE